MHVAHYNSVFIALNHLLQVLYFIDNWIMSSLAFHIFNNPSVKFIITNFLYAI